ncbi:hypothetical protein RvY_19580, partial [Ramazzottius varieornatus]
RKKLDCAFFGEKKLGLSTLELYQFITEHKRFLDSLLELVLKMIPTSMQDTMTTLRTQW